MNRTKTQFSRLLELDRRIRNREYPNCLTFAEEYQVSQKTIQRDIDFLRDMMGAPMEYDREKKGFYYTDSNFFLPALSMSEGDLLAILIGARFIEAYHGTPVAKNIEQVFSRLADILPEKLSLKPELIFTRFTFTSPPSKPISESVWVPLVRGLLSQRSLRIVYRPMSSMEPGERVIDPYHIANLAGEWYVLAHCHSKDDVIQFSIPRIQKAELLERTFEMPGDFDPDKKLALTFSRFIGSGKAQNVRLLFDTEVAPWVLERQWHPKQKVHTRADGRVELSFRITGLFEVYRWVLAWGSHCQVLEPAELKQWVKDEVRKMAKMTTRRAKDT